MIADEEYKMVRFDKYCEKCKHLNDEEWKDPCHFCLSNPLNFESDVPVKFKEKDKKDDKQRKRISKS